MVHEAPTPSHLEGAIFMVLPVCHTCHTPHMQKSTRMQSPYLDKIQCSNFLGHTTMLPIQWTMIY